MRQEAQGPRELVREMEQMDWGTGRGEDGGTPVIKNLIEHLLVPGQAFCTVNTQ